MSIQLDSYLRERASGLPVAVAASAAGLPLAEAKLTETAIERGEISLPAAGIAAPQQEELPMAKTAKPGDSGVTNLSETRDVIRNAVPRILNLKNQRKSINEQIAAEREKVNGLGVSKRALDHAIRIKEMDPEDRKAFDESYAIARDAIGLPMSGSLFDFINASYGEGEKPAAEKPAGKNGAEVTPIRAAKDHLGTGSNDQPPAAA